MHKRKDATLSDFITKLLTDQIRSGAYPVNSRLPTEKFMTEEYGVSRTVIRESISRLKSEGLVETRQGSGTVVLNPKTSEAFRLGRPDENLLQGVVHIIELRRGLESEMAALAAERHTEEELKEIVRALANIDRSVKSGGEGVAEDLAFHLAIANATGNPHYPALLGMLARALQDAIRITRGNEARKTDLSEEVRKEHEAIKSAIAARDTAAARTAAFQHMVHTADRIRAVDLDYWKGNRILAARRLAKTQFGNS